MKQYLTVFASFVIMQCIGSVYAWSIVAAELVAGFGFSAMQTQLVFGTLIAIFPITMVFTGKLSHKCHPRLFATLSGLLFALGYLIAGYSQGHFWLVYLGIGVIAGVGTGFGYWVSLSIPVQWFPHKKGLITGIAAAGFGLGAVVMAECIEFALLRSYDIMQVLRMVGLIYGVLILLMASQIHAKPTQKTLHVVKVQLGELLRTPAFRRLALGIFLGTFAGLLIIGSLKMIGSQSPIDSHSLILGVAFFSGANFCGRLLWGYVSDRIGANISLFLALFFQAAAILALDLVTLSSWSFLALASAIGFGFGGNFVLFAKETAHIYGVDRLGVYYPYVFLGYAIAGIAGPMSGGLLFDLSGSYFGAILMAALMSLMGSLIFLRQWLLARASSHS